MHLTSPAANRAAIFPAILGEESHYQGYLQNYKCVFVWARGADGLTWLEFVSTSQTLKKGRQILMSTLHVRTNFHQLDP